MLRWENKKWAKRKLFYLICSRLMVAGVWVNTCLFVFRMVSFSFIFHLLFSLLGFPRIERYIYIFFAFALVFIWFNGTFRFSVKLCALCTLDNPLSTKTYYCNLKCEWPLLRSLWAHFMRRVSWCVFILIPSDRIRLSLKFIFLFCPFLYLCVHSAVSSSLSQFSIHNSMPFWQPSL